MSKFRETPKNPSTGKYYTLRNSSTGRFVVVQTPKSGSADAPHTVVKEKYGNAIKRLGAT